MQWRLSRWISKISDSQSYRSRCNATCNFPPFGMSRRAQHVRLMTEFVMHVEPGGKAKCVLAPLDRGIRPRRHYVSSRSRCLWNTSQGRVCFDERLCDCVIALDSGDGKSSAPVPAGTELCSFSTLTRSESFYSSSLIAIYTSSPFNSSVVPSRQPSGAPSPLSRIGH